MNKLIRSIFFSRSNKKSLKESACFIICFNASTSVSSSKNKSTQLQVNSDIQKVNNSQDLLSSINSAYNKTIEVLNKTVSKVERITEIINESKTTQTNKLTLTGAEILNSVFGISQSNRLEKNITLTAAIEFINEIDADNRTKAIVADMLGITQSQDAVQETIQNARQLSESNQATTQETDQEAKSGFRLKERGLAGADISTNVDNQSSEQSTTIKNLSELLEDNSVRSSDIQNYISNLRSKTENVQEYSTKIKNTMKTITETVQQNILDAQNLKIQESEVPMISQSNEFSETLASSFEDYMKDVKHTIGEAITETSSDIEGSQETKSSQKSQQSDDQEAKGEITTDQKTTQKSIAEESIIATIIIGIVIVIGIVIAVKFYLSRKKKEESPDESPEEIIEDISIPVEQENVVEDSDDE